MWCATAGIRLREVGNVHSFRLERLPHKLHQRDPVFPPSPALSSYSSKSATVHPK